MGTWEFIALSSPLLKFSNIESFLKKTLKESYISLPSLSNTFQKTCINIKAITNTFTHYKDGSMPKDSKTLKPTLMALILDKINKNVY